VVEIVRAGAPKPPANWRQLVVTGRARSAIRRLVRATESEEFARIGRSIAESSFRREGKDYNKANLDDALRRLGLRDELALLIDIGRGRISGADLIEAVYPGRKDSKRAKLRRALIPENKARLYVRGRGKALTPGVSLDLAKCCTPLPGDRIVGILQPEVGIEVHTIDCDNLAKYEDEEERWIDLDWTPKAESDSIAIGRINLTVLHEPGALAEIAQVVGENNGNIANIRTSSRSPDFLDMHMDVEVVDAKHLSHIVAALRACRAVASAKRARDIK
jgi:GTP pyrophosphokinase/guanosine-3',5'-bis(diphosphate) 3'-pyrophosphohydrolase